VAGPLDGPFASADEAKSAAISLYFAGAADDAKTRAYVRKLEARDRQALAAAGIAQKATPPLRAWLCEEGAPARGRCFRGSQENWQASSRSIATALATTHQMRQETEQSVQSLISSSLGVGIKKCLSYNCTVTTLKALNQQCVVAPE
jgi:hypothetical protein